MSVTATSLRQHPELKSLFKNMEGRDPKDEELALYRQTVPELSDRADAAAAVRDVEGPIVRKVIKGIFATYDYEKHHQLSTAKCTRDVRYVVAYSIMCMLMGDPDWLRDKLLIWMKTILQSFEYPDLPAGRRGLVPEEAETVATLRPGQKSIYECYFSLREAMRDALEPAHFQEIEPFLTMAVDILAHD